MSIKRNKFQYLKLMPVDKFKGIFGRVVKEENISEIDKRMLVQKRA